MNGLINTNCRFTTFEDYLKHYNLTMEELNASKYYGYDFYDGYKFLKEAVERDIKDIYIIGDYDVDGILSSVEKSLIVMAFGGNPIVHIPRRISEGYGLSTKIIERIPDGAYVITVDNGIVAFDAIELAKSRNMKVMIMDHHLPETDDNGNVRLPNADVIYNPQCDGIAEYKEYCAAGLVYKFAEYLFSGQKDFLDYIGILAGIGTIADMVPLLGDNRNIVKYALSLINNNSKNIPLSILLLMEEAKLSKITSSDISFKLGPMINAPGRLLDDGAQKVYDFFMNTDYETGLAMAYEIKEYNEKRKDMTSELKNSIFDYIEKNNLYKEGHPICVYYPNIPEGLVGIIAGKIVEEYNTAVLCMTDAENGLIKGSARGNDCLHIKDTFAKYKHLLVKGGGHKNAGGFSINAKDLEIFQNSIMSEAVTLPVKYDADFMVNQSELKKWFDLKNQLEPFGTGIPEPVFYVPMFEAYPRYSAFCEYIGKLIPNTNIKSTVKIYGNGIDALGVGMTVKYQEIGAPKRVDIIGRLIGNWFNDKHTVKLMIDEIRKPSMNVVPSKEQQLLAAIAKKA